MRLPVAWPVFPSNAGVPGFPSGAKSESLFSEAKNLAVLVGKPINHFGLFLRHI